MTGHAGGGPLVPLDAYDPLPASFTKPDVLPPGPWQIDLSGGGIRSALCSLGVLYWLRQRGEWVTPGANGQPAVSRIVSVSGGSMVNCALLRQRPLTPTAIETEIKRLFKKFTCLPRVAAVVLVWLGAMAIALSSAFVDSEFLDEWRVPVVIGAALWLVIALVVRAVVGPVVLLVVAVLNAEADVSEPMEWLLIGSVVVVLPIILVTFVHVVRTVRLDLERTPKDVALGALLWLIIAVAVLLIGVAVSAVEWDSLGRLPLWDGATDAVRALGTAIALLWLVQLLVTAPVLRSHLAWIIGDKEPTARFDARQDADDWPVQQIVCTSDLREDTPVFFVSTPHHQVVVSAPTSVNTTPRIASAAKVPVVTALQASTAFVPALQPVVPLTTRKFPGFSTDWMPPLRHQVLADAGLQGTLGTQVEGIDLGASRWNFLGQTQPTKRLVLDAARYRKSVGFWWAMLLPKYGSKVVQLRIMQVSLRATVTAERRAQAAQGPLGPTRVAPASGQGYLGEFTIQQDDANRFLCFLTHVQGRVDGVWSWCPGKRRAADCVAAGVAAAIFATTGANQTGIDKLAAALAGLEGVLGRDIPARGRLQTHPPAT